MFDDKARLLVAKAMNSVKDDLQNNNEVLQFGLQMAMTTLQFLRMVAGDDAVSSLLHAELELLKTPLTPEDYPPGHPKGKQ